ncbi:MAG: hypothetical protein V3R73_06160 [Sphingomonadales bacterium]
MSILPDNPVIRERLFVAVKYITYGWLTWNLYLFYLSEGLAADVSFSGGLTLSQIVEIYSATIDSTFWILLVILLELETYAIDDEILKRTWVKWTMIGLRTICYTMIVYALYGYIVKVAFQSDILPFAVANACSLVDQSYTIILALEDYVPLTVDNCQALAGQELARLNGQDIIGLRENLIYARNVSWIDIFNASTWLGVVVILEIDVWFQLEGTFEGRLYRVSYIFKIIFYSILFACAVAWGITGVFLDFADAALWLFAFFFIEMNLFQWQQETEAAEAAA